MKIEEAIQLDHRIINDIRERADQYGIESLSEKQVSLVLRLAAELSERKADAPTGKCTFTGVIQSCKWRDSDYGGAYKLTVRVETPSGVWRAWGTLPAAIERLGDPAELVGETVQLTATVTPSDDDPAFAFFKRPRGTILNNN